MTCCNAMAEGQGPFAEPLLGERLRAIRQIIEFISRLDIDRAKVAELIAAIQKLASAETLEARVTAALELLKLVAALTPTAIDDQLSQLLDKFLTPDMLKVVVRLIGFLMGQQPDAQTQDAEPVKPLEVAEALGVPLPSLLEIAQLLILLIRVFV